MNYYTVLEISSLLKVSRFTVYRWIREDKLKSVKIQGSVRITQEELDKFLK